MRPGTQAGRNLVQNHPDRIQNRDQWQNNRQQRRDEVRQQCDEHRPGDFWNNNPNWAAWRIARPYGWATWPAVTGWVGYGAAQPTYYNYGDNVYYSGEQVYYGDQPTTTADQYAQQAQTIAAGGAGHDPAKEEWLPLGVFAVTQDGQASGAQPSLYMQIAISKQGLIAGTQQHLATGETDELQGKIDKQSQRAAWGAKGKQSPIIETGLYNLTQDTAPALIHFGDGQTQQWLLVRLKDPNVTNPSP